MRGHKRDNTETAARNFHSEDSFVGLDSHDYLAGKDWEERKAELYNRDGGRCWACGTQDALDPHHIIPRGYGGSDDLENLMLLCRTCHNVMHPEKQVRWTGGENGSQR